MKNNIYKISLIPGMIACMMLETPAICAIKNTSRAHYADAYNQVNTIRQQQEYYDTQGVIATTQSATTTLPVRVANKELETRILSNSADDVNINILDNCAMIYPSGKFEWSNPSMGLKVGTGDQCVAVVEMRSASDNTVLATATLAAGDSIKCNIDEFPMDGILPAAGKFSFPADKEPTLEDVEKVMNEEQKQNAGLKIAATAIIGGIAANMLSPKATGDTKLLGTGKQQLIGTAIGAAGAAGIAAASTYSGKVAGDTIQSTAINATAGMVVGNMTAGAAGDNTTMRIEKCEIDSVERDCIVGLIQTGESYTRSDSKKLYLMNISKDIMECEKEEDDENSLKNCKQITNRFTQVKFGQDSFDDAKKNKFENATKYEKNEDEKDSYKKTSNELNDNTYFLVESAINATNTKKVFAVPDSKLPNKVFGYTVDKDWDNLKAGHDFTFYARSTDGTAGSQIKEDSIKLPDGSRLINYFTPSSLNSDDGSLVDLSNKGRTKGTMIGAAAGGVMGGFSSYQGAKSEITDRWTEAVREYKDSLTTVYCATGTRFLATYNDLVQIDSMKTE